MTALPRRHEPVDDGVDLVLGADVDAAGRLVEDQHVGIGEQPLRQHDLLLVAAGELADGRHHAGGLDVQVPPAALGDLDLLVGVDPATAGELVEGRRGDVAADVVDEVEAVPLAVLGGVGDAVADRLGDGARLDLLAVHEQPAADVAAVGAAEHAHRELGAPGAHEPGDADDLTGPHVTGWRRRPPCGPGPGATRSSPRSAAPRRPGRDSRAG